MNPNRGFNSLYVYCDAAEAIPVGDIKLPVYMWSMQPEILIHRLYTTPQYVSVSKKKFNTLEIDARDDTGRPVPFEFGKVVATLHCRGSRNPTSYPDETVFVAMPDERYTKTIIRGKAQEERYQSSTVHARKEGMV